MIYLYHEVGYPTEEVAMPVLKEYDTKLDSKNRVTVRKPRFEHYHVIEFDDGHIELKPRVLIDPNLISANTLKMMDLSIENFKKDAVSNPIDLSEFRED